MSILRLVLLALSLAMACAAGSADAAVGCAALAREDLTTLPDAASQITAAAPRAGDTPLCLVDGYTSRAIGWRLFLPAPSASPRLRSKPWSGSKPRRPGATDLSLLPRCRNALGARANGRHSATKLW